MRRSEVNQKEEASVKSSQTAWAKVTFSKRCHGISAALFPLSLSNNFSFVSENTVVSLNSVKTLLLSPFSFILTSSFFFLYTKEKNEWNSNSINYNFDNNEETLLPHVTRVNKILQRSPEDLLCRWCDGEWSRVTHWSDWTAAVCSHNWTLFAWLCSVTIFSENNCPVNNQKINFISLAAPTHLIPPCKSMPLDHCSSLLKPAFRYFTAWWNHSISGGPLDL